MTYIRKKFLTVDERISEMIRKKGASDSLFLATNVAGLIDVLQYEKDSYIKWLYPEVKEDEK